MLSRPARESSSSPICVLLADDHHVVRSGIRRELERHEDIKVVGEARNGAEAIELACQYRPDVLLLDISMPDMNGIDVAKRLYEMPPPCESAIAWPPSILVLSAYADKEYIYSMFAVGAKGYLLKDELPRRIVDGVREVARGLPALSLIVQQALLTRRPKKQTNLSSRELEVLQLMAKGHTNEEIADDLVIAIGTVKNHVTNIYRKLPNIRTRAEAVAWAWENGLVNNN